MERGSLYGRPRRRAKTAAVERWGGAGGKGLRLAVVSKAQLAFRFGVWLQLGCTAVRPQSSQWANQSQSERTVIAPVFDYGEKQEASCSDLERERRSERERERESFLNLRERMKGINF